MLKEIFDKASAESAELGGHAEINYLCGLQAVYNAGLERQKPDAVLSNSTDGLNAVRIEKATKMAEEYLSMLRQDKAPKVHIDVMTILQGVLIGEFDNT